jgi:hypothetical protein
MECQDNNDGRDTLDNHVAYWILYKCVYIYTLRKRIGSNTMVMNTMARLSITIKPELKALAQEIAKENSTSTSRVVAECLENLARSRKEKLMAYYYRTASSEHRDYTRNSVKVIQSIAESWVD